MKCLEVANAERKRAISGYWVVGGGVKGELSFDGVFFWGDKEDLKLVTGGGSSTFSECIQRHCVVD